MAPTFLLCAGLLAAAPGATAADREVYESAQSQAGRDAGAHVDLALWCEAHGMSAERLKHLALAVLIDPKNAKARGLLGLISFQGRWQRPAEVGAVIRADEALAARRGDYNARRDQLEARFGNDPSRAAAHLELALWCEKNGLKPEATAHFTTSVMLDPSNEVPWKHLGCVKRHGVWVSREQLVAEEREAKARRKGYLRWEPLLKKWRAELTDPKLEPGANTELEQVSDPWAVSAIVRVFGTKQEHDQLRAARMLGRIDTAESTRHLASLAVFSPSELVRQKAIENLKSREPRDYADYVVEIIRTPIKFDVLKPVRGPGTPGVLQVDTPRLQLVLTYDAPPAFQLADLVNSYVGYDGFGRPLVITGPEMTRLQIEEESGLPRVEYNDIRNIELRTSLMVFEAKQKASNSESRMNADIRAIQATNGRYRAVNTHASQLLQANLGAPSLEFDENAWRAWWNDRLGYTYEPPAPVVMTLVASAQAPPSTLPPLPPPHTVCFPAGTPVRTMDGDRAIETLRVGDQVLSQDTNTGALGFQPILVVHRNGRGTIIRLRFDNGEALRASIYHRFWRAGQGWAMARDLKPGNVVRTLDGLTRVLSVARDDDAALFNLDVDESQTFFVGQHGYLVHDNRLPDTKAKPFDAPPALAAGRQGANLREGDR